MQFFRPVDQAEAALVGFGLSVMMVAPEGIPATEQKIGRLGGLGCAITIEPNVRLAMAAMAARAHDLLVIDAEGSGGLETARSILARMRLGGVATPAIIVSADVRTQVFPDHAAEPVLLRAPLSAVGLRVAVEFCLRKPLQYAA